MPENSVDSIKFTENHAIRILKEHFKVKDVRSVKVFTGSSERSKVYIALLIGDDEKAVGAGVLKIDDADRLIRENSNCAEIRKLDQQIQFLLTDPVQFIGDTETKTNLLIFKGVHGISGNLLVNPQSFADYAKEHISDNPKAVWQRLEKALNCLKPLYKKHEYPEGKSFQDIQPYTKIFTDKKEEIEKELEDLSLPWCLSLFDTESFKFDTESFKNELYQKILHACPSPNYMRLSWIHGDLNPTNILISGEQPYIIDFASSKPESHTAFDFISIETQLIIRLSEGIPIQECYDFCQRLFFLTLDRLKNSPEFEEYSLFRNPVLNHLFAVCAKLRAYAFSYLTQPNDPDYAFKDYHAGLALYAFAFIRHRTIIEKNYPKNGLALCLIISKLALDAFEGITPAFEYVPTHNPYRELEAFREEDATFYFRDKKIIENLRKSIEKKPFVALIGASGSGKSSLVFAGLVPELRKTGNWIIAHFRPKKQPVEELAGSLIPLLYKDKLEQAEKTKELSGKFHTHALGLTEIVKGIIKEYPGKRLLLIADQFEELYTNSGEPVQKDFKSGESVQEDFKSGESVQKDFTDTLLQLHAISHDNSLNMCLLLTLRADFMGKAQSFFSDMNRNAPVFLEPMNETELRNAIEKPAHKSGGVALEPGLTDQILRDLGSDLKEKPGSLPLLEFALSRMWEKQKFRQMTFAAYGEIGGLTQALARHADKVYGDFSEEEQKQVREILVQLVHPGQGTEDTRRIATYAEVKEENRKLIAELAKKRLIVTSQDEKSERESIELVHEALIRHWEKLKEWMKEDRQFRMWQERLRAALRQWETSNKDEGALLRGIPLGEAEQWLKNKRAHIIKEEIDFIVAGVALREREIREREREREEKEQERSEKERLKKRNLQILITALTILAILVGIWAIREKMQGEELQQKSNALSKSLTETERAKNAAVEREKQARHNLGFVFTEKAEKALERKEMNAARLYALHALANLDPARAENERKKVTEIILNQPDYPMIFSTPVGSHHNGSVNSVAFSPDGKTIASGSDDTTIRLWNAETGKEKTVLTGHTYSVLSMSFSSNGKMLASGSIDKTVRFWDMETGKEKFLRLMHRTSVINVNFSPDGKTLASSETGVHSTLSSSHYGDIHLWDVETGKEKMQLFGHMATVISMRFSPDGKTLASGSADETIRLWDIETGKEKFRLSGHTNSVSTVSFSPDGQTLVSGSDDKTIRLWNVETGKEKKRLEGHVLNVRTVSFSPDGKNIASGAWDRTIRLWDAETGKEQLQFIGHTDDIKCINFSSDGKTLVSGSSDNTIRLWDIATGKEKRQIFGHTGSVSTVAYSPDGKNFVSGSSDGTIRLWNSETGKEKGRLEGNLAVKSVSYSPDGKNLASGLSDGTIRLWNSETGKEQLKISVNMRGISRDISTVNFSPDGKMLASGSGADYIIHLWDIPTGKEKGQFSGHTNSVFTVSFSPDGRTMASGASDKTIRVWDVETKKEKFHILGHTDTVLSLSYSPDGKTLVSGSSDKTIHLWDAETGKEQSLLIGHTHSVNSVVFSPDGKTLASGSSDKTSRLWDIETGKEKAVLTGHIASVNSVAFSPDGKTLISGSTDHTIKLWKVETEKPVLTGHMSSVKNVSFSQDSKTLTSGSWDGTIRLWDMETGKEKLNLLQEASFNVCISPDGKMLASGLSDKSICLWDAETGKEKLKILNDNGYILSVSFSPDGETLASGSSENNTVCLWDVKTGKKKAQFGGKTKHSVTSVRFSPDGKTLASSRTGDLLYISSIYLWDVETGKGKSEIVLSHVANIWNIDFSPDGKTLASGLSDNNIILWNVDTGKEKYRFMGHTDPVSTVCFSPDGKLLASGSGSFLGNPLDNPSDKTIRLWDMETGKEKVLLIGHNAPVNSICFSKDGRILASGSSDNTIRLWNISFLYDEGTIEEKITDSEQKYNLKMINVDLQPIRSDRNLYGVPAQPPRWPKTHPFHWLSKAEAGDAEAMLKLGIIYHRDDNYEQAAYWYRKATDSGNKDALERLKWVLKHQVKLFFGNNITYNDDSKVLNICNEIISLDPEYADAYLLRGIFYFIQIQFAQAEADVSKAIELNPEEPRYYWQRGLIYLNRKQFNQAESDWRKVTELNPNAGDAFGSLGWLLIQQGRFKESQEFARKAHEISPENFSWTINLGHSYLQDDPETAKEYYQKSIPQIPDEENFRNGPQADFELFIQNNWKAEQSRKMLKWFEDEYRKYQKSKAERLSEP